MGIDLDAARVARREAGKKGPVVTFGGESFELPVEVPFEVMVRVSELSEAQVADDATDEQKTAAAIKAAEAVTSIMQSLLGERYDKFMAKSPSVEDLMTLVDGLLTEYGLGEAEASGAS